jgi:hypothetical protein
MKAISSPEGRAKMEMGDEGFPQGYRTLSQTWSAMSITCKTLLKLNSKRGQAHGVDLDIADKGEVVKLVQP